MTLIPMDEDAGEPVDRGDAQPRRLHPAAGSRRSSPKRGRIAWGLWAGGAMLLALGFVALWLIWGFRWPPTTVVVMAAPDAVEESPLPARFSPEKTELEER